MDCIYCDGKTKVTSTRHTKTKGLRRTRVCKKCNGIFNTTEIVDEEDLNG